MSTEIYTELESLTPWDCDRSKIPENGTLVAVDLASCGLANMVVRGYHLTCYKGMVQIRIKLSETCNQKVCNERMFADIYHPLTIREKGLLDNIKSRRKS